MRFARMSPLDIRSPVFFCRLWWIAAFALSSSLCMSFVYVMWLEWSENPVIISFDHRSSHKSVVPFPALTICPMTKIKSNTFNYTQIYRSIAKLDGNNHRIPNQTEYTEKIVFIELSLKIKFFSDYNSCEWHFKRVPNGAGRRFEKNLMIISQIAPYFRPLQKWHRLLTTSLYFVNYSIYLRIVRNFFFQFSPKKVYAIR